jgi:6-phosphogluconolactonase (cycloisomerase 2 family)
MADGGSCTCQSPYVPTSKKFSQMRVRKGIPKWAGAILLGATAATTATATVPAALAAPSSAPVVGQVYVNDNSAGSNTIAGFDRHADGSLTPVASSPFNAGGAGTGSGGLASQGALQLARDGRFLIAVDAGSNQISVLRAERNGALRLVRGGVVGSGGTLPVSVAVHGNLVYVANAGTSDSNYTGFTLSRNGNLQPLVGSTVSLPDGSQPGDVLFNSTGTNLVGTRVNSSLIDSFHVNRNGRLEAAPDSPFAPQAAGPFGSEFRPTDSSQLFVTNAHQGATLGSVSAFSAANDGTLSPITPVPFANGQTGTCWVEITHDGNWLFALNTGTGTISGYSIAPDGKLTLLGNTAVSSSGGVGAVDLRLSSDGKFLFVDESKANAIATFAVNDGDLTQIPGISLPAGASAAGIVAS